MLTGTVFLTRLSSLRLSNYWHSYHCIYLCLGEQSRITKMQPGIHIIAFISVLEHTNHRATKMHAGIHIIAYVYVLEHAIH